VDYRVVVVNVCCHFRYVILPLICLVHFTVHLYIVNSGEIVIFLFIMFNINGICQICRCVQLSNYVKAKIIDLRFSCNSLLYSFPINN
jgi:hypothetical protein